MQPSDQLLTPSDSIRYDLPEPYPLPLTVADCDEIYQLIVSTTRAPHLCISKGQYKHLCEQLGARNHMLAKAVKHYSDECVALRKRVAALEAQLGDDGK